jgi:hypothetical protein
LEADDPDVWGKLLIVSLPGSGDQQNFVPGCAQQAGKIVYIAGNAADDFGRQLGG